MSTSNPRAAMPSVAPDALGSDLKLAKRLAMGDGPAWKLFISQYGRLIRARVADVASSFGMGRDDDAIDDATADVVMTLLQNNAAALRSFAGKSALSTFVAVIATRTATRCFAAKKNVAAGELDAQNCVDTADRTISDPSHRLLAKEQQAQVQRVIKCLPPKQREAVDLFHLQGCSYIEVSERLKMPIGSVGVTLRRAEAKMKELLEPD